MKASTMDCSLLPACNSSTTLNPKYTVTGKVLVFRTPALDQCLHEMKLELAKYSQTTNGINMGQDNNVGIAPTVDFSVCLTTKNAWVGAGVKGIVHAEESSKNKTNDFSSTVPLIHQKTATLGHLTPIKETRP